MKSQVAILQPPQSPVEDMLKPGNGRTFWPSGGTKTPPMATNSIYLIDLGLLKAPGYDRHQPGTCLYRSAPAYEKSGSDSTAPSQSPVEDMVNSGYGRTFWPSGGTKTPPMATNSIYFIDLGLLKAPGYNRHQPGTCLYRSAPAYEKSGSNFTAPPKALWKTW